MSMLIILIFSMILNVILYALNCKWWAKNKELEEQSNEKRAIIVEEQWHVSNGFRIKDGKIKFIK